MGIETEGGKYDFGIDANYLDAVNAISLFSESVNIMVVHNQRQQAEMSTFTEQMRKYDLKVQQDFGTSLMSGIDATHNSKMANLKTHNQDTSQEQERYSKQVINVEKERSKEILKILDAAAQKKAAIAKQSGSLMSAADQESFAKKASDANKQGMAAVGSGAQAVSQLLGSFESTLDAIGKGYDKTTAFVNLGIEAGQKVADVIGQITGLPVGQIFGAITSSIKTVVRLISKATLKFDAAYLQITRRTKIVAGLVKQWDYLGKLRSNQLTQDEQINAMYKARRDTADEMIVANDKALLQYKFIATELNRVIGADAMTSTAGMSDFDKRVTQRRDAADALAVADAKRAQAQKELDAGGQSAKDKKRSEADLAKAEADIAALDILLVKYDDMIEKMQDIDDLRRLAFEDSLDELEHRKAMGDYDEDEAGFLDQKRVILEDLYAQAQADYAEGLISKQQLWEYELRLKDVTDERLGLEKDITGEVVAQTDAEVKRLHIARQELITKGRAGDLTAAERARLKALEDDIIAAMTKAGASDTDIDSTRATFAQASYEQGTHSVPETGLYQLHKAERVLSADDNKWLTGTTSAMSQQIGILSRMLQEAYTGSSFSVGQVTILVDAKAHESPELIADRTAARFMSLHKQSHAWNGTDGHR